MDIGEFQREAEFIVRRNVSERVERVLANFDLSTSGLRVVYYTKSNPTDADWEDCELSCAELIAAFPEVESAETRCVSIAESSDDEAGFVAFSSRKNDGKI